MLLEVKSLSAFFNSLLCTVFLVCAVFQIPRFNVVLPCCIVQCLSHHCFDEACLPIHIHLLLCWWCLTLYIHLVFLLELDIKTFLCIVSKRSYRSYRREDDVPLEYKRVNFQQQCREKLFLHSNQMQHMHNAHNVGRIQAWVHPQRNVMLSAKFSFQPRQCRAQCIWGAAEQTCLARWVPRVVSMDPAPLPSSSTLHIFDTTQRLSSCQYYIRFF